MTMFSTPLRQLVVEPDDLVTLSNIAAGTQPLESAPNHFADSGIADVHGLDPLAAAMASTAVSPDRAVHLERIAGHYHHAMWVGWERDGRAVMSSYDVGGDVVVSGTQLSMLPVLIMQWLGLRPRPAADDRVPLTVSRCEMETRAATQHDRLDDRDDRDHLDLVLTSNLSWKAFGVWRGGTIDAELTVVDGGTSGLWSVVCDGDRGRDDEVITFVPIDAQRAAELLGDVVTGRTATNSAPTMPG